MTGTWKLIEIHWILFKIPLAILLTIFLFIPLDIQPSDFITSIQSDNIFIFLLKFIFNSQLYVELA